MLSLICANVIIAAVLIDAQVEADSTRHMNYIWHYRNDINGI